MKQKLPFVVLTALVLISLAATFAYVRKVGPFKKAATENTSNIDYNKPSQEQVDEGQDIKQQNVDQPNSSSESNSSKSNSTDQQDKNNSLKNVAVSFDVSGKKPLKVSTLVQERKTDSSGTCTLTLTKSGQTAIVKTAKTQVSGTVSTCQGFTIDTGSRSGTWQFQLKYESNTGSGSATQEVSL